MQTLLLDIDKWDLVADAAGNIGVAGEPYALAQDAASAIRLFEGELYYDTTLGIPYFDQVLGQSPPVSLVKAYFVQAALRVPGVVKARAFISSWTDRRVRGQVQTEDAAGNKSSAGF